MPSLADTLAQLSHQSEEIKRLSSQNLRPAGPFVQAYLQVSPSSSASASSSKPRRPPPTRSVNELIRDSDESEKRLFKYIGEDRGVISGGGVGVKRVEKREGGIVTPLKELRKGRQGDASARGAGDEIEILLRTAGKLVDDYHPMPRARAHINNLLETHHSRQQKIADLERQIAELNDGVSSSSTSTTSSSAPPPVSPENTASTPKLSVEEAIKLEEDALKALDAQIAPHRRAAFAKTNNVGSPKEDTSPPTSPAQTSGDTTVLSRSVNGNTRTPAKTPVVTNSLVNGTTPHRQIPATGSRFSPLRFLGTPRNAGIRAGDKSGLRSVVKPGGWDEDELGSRPIFGRASLKRSTSSQKASSDLLPPQQSVSGNAEDDRDATEQPGEDDTIRLAPPLPLFVTSPPDSRSTPDRATLLRESVESQSDLTPKASGSASPRRPRPSASPADKGPKKVEGVEVGLESVRVAVGKIWSTLGDMMHQGVAPGKSIGQSSEETIKHIYNLSKSDPDPPPSPSTSSSLSSLSSIPSNNAAAKALPITPSTILLAHLCLLLLRSATPSNPDGSVAMSEVKERLSAIAKARGWEGGHTGAISAGDLGTKVVYGAVGKRVVRIDRRGGGSGRLKFAE